MRVAGPAGNIVFCACGRLHLHLAWGDVVDVPGEGAAVTLAQLAALASDALRRLHERRKGGGPGR